MRIQQEEKCLTSTTAFKVGNGSLDKLLNNSHVKNLNLLRWVLIQASFIHFCPPNYFSTYCREEEGLHNIPCETLLSEF